MGEFGQYRGERIKVGTCEDLIYLRADQRDLVDTSAHDDAQIERSLDTYRFRFPWPDEDGTEPGRYAGERMVVIPGYCPEADYPLQEGPPVPPIRLMWQGLREGELRSIVWDSAGEHLSGCQMFQLSKLEALRAAVALVKAARVELAGNPQTSMFYTKVAERMLWGYAVELDRLQKEAG